VTNEVGYLASKFQAPQCGGGSLFSAGLAALTNAELAGGADYVADNLAGLFGLYR
jgi:hypothetical protein